MGPLKEQVLALASSDPILYSVISLYRNGKATWDNALEMAVIIMVQDRKRVMEMSVQTLMASNRQAPPVAKAPEPVKTNHEKLVKLPPFATRLDYFKAHGYWPDDPIAKRPLQ